MTDNVSVIIIEINANDNTASGAASATQTVSRLEQSLNKTQKRIDDMNKRSRLEIAITAVDRASKVMDSVMSSGKRLAGTVFNVTLKAVDLVTAPIRGILGGVRSMIGGVLNPILQGMGISAGMGLGSLISQGIGNAGRRETMNISMNAVARSTGTDIQLLEIQKSAVMKLGIAEQEATGIMTQFMQAELDIAHASKIARVAQDAAVISGQNSSEAAATMVDAISSLNPVLLKQFGMTRGMNDIYADYADKLGIVVKTKDKYGKTARHLTRDLEDAEKKQAILNYVLDQGNKIAGTYEDAMSSPFKKLGSLPRYFTTLMEKVNEPLLLPVFGKAVDGATGLLKKAIDWAEGNQGLLQKWGDAIADGVENAVNAVTGAVKRMIDSPEWARADTFFGKLGVAWDKLIAEPFGRWWNSKGKGFLSSVANTIGEGIGSAIKFGITAIFGGDAGGVLDDGISVGRSFADGFSKGIEGINWGKVADGIVDAFKKVLGLLFSNPVTGAITSLFIGQKLAGGASGILNIGKGIKSGWTSLFGSGAAAGGEVSGAGAAFSGIAQGLSLA
ncbi:MAG: hypothetical protein FWE80_01945, partial [Oscillospiraceae bacterium]|nr:hypothetical protein [Oscillospiraceae bacterium]